MVFLSSCSNGLVEDTCSHGGRIWRYFFHLAFWGCWEKMIIFHYGEAKFPVYTTQCPIPSTMWWRQFKKKILIYSIWTGSKNTCRILSFATPFHSYFFDLNVACSYMHFGIFYLKKYLIIFYNYVLYYNSIFLVICYSFSWQFVWIFPLHLRLSLHLFSSQRGHESFASAGDAGIARRKSGRL